MVRILFVSNPQSLNPYVRTLANGVNEIKDKYIADISIEKFWKDDVFLYDIVHVMWPSDLLLLHNKFMRKSIGQLKKRIDDIKGKGIKFVTTCHNLAPHYSSDEEKIASYALVYSHSDIIFHLGRYSLSLFEKEYPYSKNKLLLHHVYDTLYDNNLNKSESRDKLGLKQNYKYILCFGAIRNSEERKLVNELGQYFKNKGVTIICPSLSLVQRRKNPVIFFKSLISYLKNSVTSVNIINNMFPVSDSMLPYYFAASDTVFIPRLKILNSGNLSMGLFMGKVVVGPNTGNVGMILKETGNPVFDPTNFQSIVKAAETSLMLEGSRKGEQNREYAKNNLLTVVIVKRLLNYYSEL